MKVLLVNTSQLSGGAAIAAGRLCQALRRNGVDARMLVRDRANDDPAVVSLPADFRRRMQFVAERGLIYAANGFNRHDLFSLDTGSFGTDITRLKEFQEADVIHLHWINQGMMSLRDIEAVMMSGKPVVWTMHDMWPFTGVCHYSGSCTRYTERCRSCPQLRLRGRHDLSAITFGKKAAIYDKAPQATFVACSEWLASLGQQSRLLRRHRVTSIPNAIDTSVFTPGDKQAARAAFALPADGPLLLFGSAKVSDTRKGADYFIAACRELAATHSDVGVVVFGNDATQLQSLLPYPVYSLGYITEQHQLAAAYNAVDAFVIPSLQDNLPNTIVEAMSCGVPCVAFATGGIPQMIDHLKNGYLASSRSSHDLADGMAWLLDHPEYETISRAARMTAEATYSEPVAAARYTALYRSLLR